MAESGSIPDCEMSFSSDQFLSSLFSFAYLGDIIYDSADALNSTTAQVGEADSIPKLLASRNRVICLADYIVPGHGPLFQVTAAMRTLAQCSKCFK